MNNFSHNGKVQFVFAVMFILAGSACGSIKPAEQTTTESIITSDTSSEGINQIITPTDMPISTAEHPAPLKLMGQIGGSSLAVAYQNNLVFLGQGPRLLALDITELDKPKYLGESEVLTGLVQDIQIRGDFAYVVTRNGGLHILNFSDPTQIQLTSEILFPPGGCNALTIEGKYAYLACKPDGFIIVDISNPERPVQKNANLVNRDLVSIANRGQYSYVLDKTQNAVVVMDRSDATNPQPIFILMAQQIPGDTTNPPHFLNLKICGGYLCVTAGSHGLYIFDINNLARPTFIGSYETPAASGLASENFMVYLTDDTEGVILLDISQPEKPRRMGTVHYEGGTFEYSAQSDSGRGMSVKNGIVLVTDLKFGLEILDISTLSNPMRKVRYQPPLPEQITNIEIQENIAYITSEGGGFRIEDISNTSNPTELSYDNEPKNLYSQALTGLAVQDKYAYVTDLHTPLRIYQIDDPANPILVSQLWSNIGPPGAMDIAVSGDIAFLSGLKSLESKYKGIGLWVIDIADRTQPFPIGFVDLPNAAWKLTIIQNYLYAFDIEPDTSQNEPLSLRILDISNLSQPDVLQTIPFEKISPLSGFPSLTGDLILFSHLGHPIRVLETSNPLQPSVLGEFPVFLTSNFVASEPFSTSILNLAGVFQSLKDQTSYSSELASFPREISSFDILNDQIFIAADFQGLYVYQIKP
jgi:hypothetical protein